MRAEFRLVWVAAILLTLGLTTGAWSQAPMPLTDDPIGGPPSAAPAAPSATTPAGEAAKPDPKAEEANKKAQRLQKIQQLPFDRRPSAILKAWSTPPGAEPAAEEKTPAVTAVPQPGSPPQPATDNPKPAPDPFDAELKSFQRHVTLGNWPEVKAYLASLEKEEAKALYTRLLTALREVAPHNLAADLPPHIAAQLAQQIAQLQQMQAQSRGQQQQEKPVLSFADVLALAAARPCELDAALLSSLGSLLRVPLEQGYVVGDLTALLKQESAKPKEQAAIDRRQAAKLLFATGQETAAGDFLPTVAEAESAQDHEGLNLLSRYYLALYAKEKETAYLEQAWNVTQAVLASKDVKTPEKHQALARAVDLAPQIKEEFGQRWLEESFTKRPERGMEILATIGSSSSQALQTSMRDPAERLKGLQLQNTAVEGLLAAAPQTADQWRPTLHLLAANWLREAVFSAQNDRTTSFGPRIQRDPYGNIFYFDEEQYLNQYRQMSGLPAIKTGELLSIRPSNVWMDHVDASLRPKFDMICAQLYLKVNEEDSAFPFIERLAKSHPELGVDLTSEFLRLWTQNHDPNATRNRTMQYMFMYGFERRVESIPLTRSKQERNLRELSALVPRLKAIAGDKLDQSLLAKAFTTCHSSAEVYRLDAIEEVFGPIAELKPKLLAELVQQMRSNLGGLWRQPALQEQAKTKRKQKDIEAEVLRGYQLAKSVIESAQKSHPDDWSLELAVAALAHDENNYRRQIAGDSKYSQRRQDSFALFQRAAELYAAQAGGLRDEEHSTQVYELWFYASLGACDLGQINEESVPDLKQASLVRRAIEALPEAAVEHHRSMFANLLFTRISAVNPASKFRYLRSGFEIVGDHTQAREARKVFDYYSDLVTEVKLEAVLDGSDVVGQGEPFGLFVNLRHTRDIERESGGFGRYLINQNNLGYAYNYGRPTANYREKFEEAARKALQEHFEVLSVTFQDANVNSRTASEEGWRITPYAYLLLKSRGPQVDKIPPLKLDLDFLDTSGYVVLPIETNAVAIDASGKRQPRPYEKLSVRQILDERQSADGKLILEVKATAQGLVPPLAEMLSVKPADFEVTGIEDEGVSVSKFDPDAEGNSILSERLWQISLRAKDGLSQAPKKFRFAEPLVDVHEVAYHRYVDADLSKVDAEVVLEAKYKSRSNAGYWWAVGVGGGLIFAIGLWWLWPRKKETGAASRFEIPEPINPFTVLGLLEEIQQHDGLSDDGRRELAASIARIERHYFADENGEAPPDLKELAETWVRRAR
jgi:hypothetical protein